MRVRRVSYDRPLQGTVRRGGLLRRMPPALLDGFNGLARFGSTQLLRSSGTPLGQPTYATTCLNGDRSRISPSAPATSAYPPFSCFGNPFPLGGLSGVDAGWAVRLDVVAPIADDLPDGRYRVRVVLRDRTASLLGIPKRQRTQTVRIRLRTVREGDGGPREGKRAAIAALPDAGTPRAGSTADPSLAPPRPAAARTVPADTLPDLRALPSWGISTSVIDGRDYLDFGATTWNAGPGPLAIDGYRRRGEAVMDSYQSFYRRGEIVAARKVGEMEYDARVGHEHWHFRDFSRYDLLDARRTRVQTSGKEAWCLAPTDSVDLLAPGAAMSPGNGDLQTACGNASAIWVREVLAAGWGDTYSQARPGQSFDITAVPNGTYFIRIVANPGGRIIERSRANNVALRRIVLGGGPGARTVRVPRVGLIDSEAPQGGGPTSPPAEARRGGAGARARPRR